MKSIAIIFLAAITLLSCSDINQSKQLNSIDKMSKSIDSLAKVLKENHNDTALVTSRMMQNIELRFKTYYIVDTIDPVFADEINDFKQARKGMAHLQKDNSKFSSGAKEMKESLRQLRYDIENGDGDRKKYDEYIQFEASKLSTLRRLSEDHVKQSKSCWEVFDRLYQKFDKFTLELMKKNAKKVGM